MKMYQYVKNNGIWQIILYDVPYQPGEIVFAIKTKGGILITKNPPKEALTYAKPKRVMLNKQKPVIFIYSKRPIDRYEIDKYGDILLYY